MDMKEFFQCGSKIKFRSEHKALAWIEKMKKNGKWIISKYRVYECLYCHYFHLTRIKK